MTALINPMLTLVHADCAQRTYIRKNRWIWGISQVYKNTNDLCADLEANFDDFRAFAEGDPAFFRPAPGPRFLSFAELSRKQSCTFSPPHFHFAWRILWSIRRKNSCG